MNDLPINEIIHGDCLDIFKDIPDNSIDFILTDPPYNTTACKWEYDIFKKIDIFWKEINRIVKQKSAIAIFSAQPFTSKLVCSNLEQFRYEIIWNKSKSSNFQMMNFQPGRIHENILIFSNSPAVFSRGNNMVYYPQMTKLETPRIAKKTFYGGQKHSTLREGHTIKDIGEKVYLEKHPTSIITFSNANSKSKIYPTEKPVSILEYLIKTFTIENDIILDCFAGSGSTGLAAKNLNRKYILIEKDINAINIIKSRNL